MLVDNRNQNIENNRKHLELYINHAIIILTVILLAFYFPRKTTEDQEFEKFLSDNSFSSSLRNLEDNPENPQNNTEFNFEEFEEKVQKKEILAQLLHSGYKGKWESNDSKIGDKSSGLIFLRFDHFTDHITNEQMLVIIFRCFEDQYLDNWVLSRSSGNLSQILNGMVKPNSTENIVELKGKFTTSLGRGKMFNEIYSPMKTCKSNIKMKFPPSYTLIISKLGENKTRVTNITSINPNSLLMKFESDCGMNITMKVEIDRTTAKEIRQKVNSYSIAVIASCILCMMSTTIMKYHLDMKELNVNAMSLVTTGQNFLWHSYCCMSHITFAINFHILIFKFIMISGLYLLCFSLFDMRLLCTYWSIQNRRLTSSQYLKTKIKFYVFFYVIFFGSFLILEKLYYEKICIVILFILLWTPQIIFNAVNNNKTGIPLFYIFATSFDRILIPIYFRGNNGNFFMIKRDCFLITLLTIFVFACIIMLVLQNRFGARFFLPEKCQVKEFDFYKTWDELVKEKKDVANEECVICLSPLIDINNFQSITNRPSDNTLKVESPKENSASETTNDSSLMVNPVVEIKKSEDINLVSENNQEKESCSSKLLYIFKFSCDLFFNFYKIKKKNQHKKYMLTPCHHAFHSICLEEWFQRKKECPNCRAIMFE